MGFLDEKHYTDVKTGKKISLRNASTLGVNTHFSNNCISVYDKSTNTHHQVSDAFDTEDDAIEYMGEYNKQMRSEVVSDTYSQASHREMEQAQARKAERVKESEDRESSLSNYVFID